MLDGIGTIYPLLGQILVVGHVLLESGQFPAGEPKSSDGTYDAERSFDLGVRALLTGLAPTAPD